MDKLTITIEFANSQELMEFVELIKGWEESKEKALINKDKLLHGDNDLE